MFTSNGRRVFAMMIALAAGGVLIAAAYGVPAGAAAPARFPALALNRGEFYFSIDGKPGFVLSRNITGKIQDDFDNQLQWAYQGGTRLVRVHLTHGWWGDAWINKDWTVNEKWARDWDRFFDQAQAEGIFILPVFGVWADWNGGRPDYGSPFWQFNPLNQANGGPVDAPAELFQAGSETQKQWLAWIRTLVERWRGRENIAAWEVFSEINIATGPSAGADAKGGVTEAAGVDFTNRAMAVIRAADVRHRPVTLSLAGTYAPNDKWADYYGLDSLDFIEIHPYNDALDRELVKEVREYLVKYEKPVLIGESGLWSMTHRANAMRGISHAVWAGLVSGAMNGRALWDQDGYMIYAAANREEAVRFMQTYAIAELPVTRFVRSLDFTGFRPLSAVSTPRVWGAVVGSENTVAGWYRDAACEPPDWKLRSSLTRQTVTVTVPGQAANWRIDFYDAKTGLALGSSVTASRKGGKVIVPLPEFTDDIAFQMFAQP